MNGACYGAGMKKLVGDPEVLMARRRAQVAASAHRRSYERRGLEPPPHDYKPQGQRTVSYSLFQSRQRAYHLRHTYHWEDWEIDALQDEQNCTCAICEEPLTSVPCVDHDHATGDVRGLLCTRCNTLLAGLDDAQWRERAEGYLSRVRTRS